MGFFFLALIVLGIIVAGVVGRTKTGGSAHRRVLAVLIGIYSVLTVVFLFGILFEGNCHASSDVMAQYQRFLNAEHFLGAFFVACLAGPVMLVRRDAYALALACLVAPPLGWIAINQLLYPKNGVGCMFL